MRIQKGSPEANNQAMELTEKEYRLSVDIRERALSKNTRYSYEKDLRYFWRWYAIRHDGKDSIEPFYPIPATIIYRFVLDHLYEMPSEVEKRLQNLPVSHKENEHVPIKVKNGQHKWATVRRRLAAITHAHSERGLILNDPVRHPEVRKLLANSRLDLAGSPQCKIDKKAAATMDIVEQMIEACELAVIQGRIHSNSTALLTGLRDKAAILVAFSSGGRRRSEIANLRVEDLEKTQDGYLLTIQKSKTDKLGKGVQVPVLGRAAIALSSWLSESGIKTGKVFRGVDRWGNIKDSFSDKTFANLVKRRLREAGLDERQYSAHSLRSGFITECGRQNIPIQEAMQLSLHSSLEVAIGYHRTGSMEVSRAARLLSRKR